MFNVLLLYQAAVKIIVLRWLLGLIVMCCYDPLEYPNGPVLLHICRALLRVPAPHNHAWKIEINLNPKKSYNSAQWLEFFSATLQNAVHYRCDFFYTNITLRCHMWCLKLFPSGCYTWSCQIPCWNLLQTARAITPADWDTWILITQVQCPIKVRLPTQSEAWNLWLVSAWMWLIRRGSLF